MVKLAEGLPVHIIAREENNFKIQPDELQQSISEKTKAIILCNPSNPTGAVYSRIELSALAEVVNSRDIFIISDEVYAKLIYEGTNFCSISSVNDELREKSIIVTGVSKSYAMTGWRIGYAAGNREIIEAANKIQSHSTSNACTISQYAAHEALSGPQDSVDQMRKIFEERRNLIFNKLSEIRGMKCVKPMGAFYVFPNISQYIKMKDSKIHLENSEEFAQFLLDKARVVVVPGSAFGSDDHTRISYSNSVENIEEGMHRISEVLSDLLP
jgi:aspartate aminotransferase